MKRGRKRIVIVEKLLTNNKSHTNPSTVQQIISQSIINSELFIKNRFYVELEKEDGTKMCESRIRGFKIEDCAEKKVLMVRTFLHINEWIDEYKKVVIARIVLLDSIGNEISSFDLDIDFKGYSMECDYDSEDYVTPWFSYSILDD